LPKLHSDAPGETYKNGRGYRNKERPVMGAGIQDRETAGRAGIQLASAAGAVLAFLTLTNAPARAQLSANDGYAADGSYHLQFELTPYLWLPATNTNFSLGPQGGISGNVNTGVPTAAQLRNSLHGAFMGFGLVRYGPWSGELDIDWVDASTGKTAIGPRGNALHLSTSASLVRVAPGFGYEVARGAIAGIPATLDARAGFSWLHSSSSIGSLEEPLGGGSDSASFVQPWLGTRATFFPSSRWRVELGALVQGFGVSGGSWGWGASFLVSYAVTDWMVVTGGIRALKTERIEDNVGPLGSGKRSFDLVAYGPLLGVGFRF